LRTRWADPQLNPPPPGAKPSFYHAWGVANPNCNEWTVTGLPLAAEEYFKKKGIHVAFNCQKHLPNWIHMITNSGTCDIMFRSKTDLEAYRAYDTNWKPFLISRISGQASLVESKPNEVAFHETLGPFRLSLYNLMGRAKGGAAAFSGPSRWATSYGAGSDLGRV
jgi:hypothetical protein